MNKTLELIADAVATICIVFVGIICVALTVKFAATYIL